MNKNPYCICSHTEDYHIKNEGICLHDSHMGLKTPGKWCDIFRSDNLKYLELILKEKENERIKT